jgi:hypothetical protein
MSLERSPGKLRYSIDSVKNIFSKISLTPEFKVTFDDPPNDRSISSYTLMQHLKDAGVLGLTSDGQFKEKLELLCFNTSLPGSAFDMYQVVGDRQGQFEIFPSTRDFGRQITLNFYVDTEHKVIRFFEEWMNFMNPLVSSVGKVDSTNNGQNLSKSPLNSNNVTRMRYPKSYRFNFLITKFEKDVGYNQTASDYLSYEFVDAFPIIISPMKVSYGTSDKLTISVTMAYQRYITRNKPRAVFNNL